MASKTVKRSILRVAALTYTLDHFEDCGKITEKKSLSTYAIAEMLYMILIMKYINLLIN